MPKEAKVHLHGIDAAFRDVLAQLQALKKEADTAQAAKIDIKLRRLGKLRKQVSRVCPELFFVWPVAELKVAARRRKTGSKTKKGGR